MAETLRDMRAMLGPELKAVTGDAKGIDEVSWTKGYPTPPIPNPNPDPPKATLPRPFLTPTLTHQRLPYPAHS